MTNKLDVSGPLWRWADAQNGNWFFVSIKDNVGEYIAAHALIRRLENGRARGFGSVRVGATIGSSHWRTSVFPSKKHGWILPIKSAIRRAENVGEGDVVKLVLELD